MTITIYNEHKELKLCVTLVQSWVMTIYPWV